MKNPTIENPNAPYYVQEKKFLSDLIPNGPNVVMDLGCASGRLGRKLLELRKAQEVVGVEIFESAASEAALHYEKVHVGDIEDMDLDYQGHFDVVICGDILEHLKEPSKIIKKIHGWLKDEGQLLCCVPNIRYWRVWRDVVLRGDFEYASEGILDQTHLRFFTRRSFERMLETAGFRVEHSDMRLAAGSKHRIANQLTLGCLKELLGFQIIVSARKNKRTNK